MHVPYAVLRAGSVGAVGFTTPGSDFKLLNTSAGYQAGPTGADLGYNQGVVNTLLARVA